MSVDVRTSGATAVDTPELIARLRSGDASAFEVVYCAYFSTLCQVAARYVPTGEDAQEVAQDTLCRIWERRASLEISGSLADYLCAAARNRALNYLRRLRRLARDEAGIDHESYTAPAADAAVHARALEAAVRAAIDALPARCRETYLLQRQGGLSYAKVARRMGVSAATVKVQMGRALQALREHLAPFLER